jgi:hypothetical protein
VPEGASFSMQMFGLDNVSVRTSLLIILMISVSLIGNYGRQNASACQVSINRPAIYENSEVIFIGTVTQIDRGVPLEHGSHVTFLVSKAWKGIDTQLVTIHNGYSQYSVCGPFPLFKNQEVLVYGGKDLFEIYLASGTMTKEPSQYFERDVQYLDSLYSPIDLKEGHTRSVNIIPFLQILGTLLAISAVAFVLIKRS